MKKTILALLLLTAVWPAHAAPRSSREARKTEQLARKLTERYERRQQRRQKSAAAATATRMDPFQYMEWYHNGSGAELEKRVAKVETLNWQRDLAKAKRLSTRSGKPILWVQALGDLSGLL